MLQAQDYVRLVDATMPPGYLRDLVNLVVRSYRGADEFCRERFSHPVARDHRPHLRRALIEEGWLALAAKHPGVAAESTPNRIGSAFHTVVRCGTIVLTASKVDGPEDLPRHALFRKTYARQPQMVLDLPGVAPPPDVSLAAEADGLYALLTHGPAEDDPSAPAFVQLGFPTPTCSAYVARVDLLARYHLASTPASAVEIQPAEPTLRERVRRQGEGGA